MQNVVPWLMQEEFLIIWLIAMWSPTIQ
uniref:Uncharacterized protein n=1 Tax=Rhizophora mucronata TaxID=61149 RepID=A0A2P2NDJ7_RHIMU